MRRRGLLPALVALAQLLVAPLAAQDLDRYSQAGLERALAEAGTARLGVRVPMRDGIGLATDVYTPKDAHGALPTILWKTPYNEHKLAGMTLRYAVEAVRHGYAFILQNERGRYFSEGKYEILGKPQTDGYDALSWIAAQPWSNGKVGTLGCSSSAEWQLALAAMRHPAHAAMVPMSAGAGIGHVGRFWEQGNFYMGGVPRTLFVPWIYDVDNPLRAQLPPIADEALRARVEGYNDLEVTKPKVAWSRQMRHLPYDTVLTDLGEPPATFERFVHRAPGDPAWHEGGLYHDDMAFGVPALWFNTWYDVSIGANMEMFNHVRAGGATATVRDNQYAIVAPVAHCQYARLGPHTTVGERDMGDTSFDVDGTIWAWFDRWLKNRADAFPATTPHVRYYEMGANRWRAAAAWPPKDVAPLRLYLRSGGHANSLSGDGRLDAAAPPAGEAADRFRDDPLNPVPTIGGGDCCNGGIVIPGAFDQRPAEARDDVLVYTGAPLDKPLAVAGFVEAVLRVSSSAPDTDFAVKLVDVAPDGTAWIIGDTILRARYRDGFDHAAGPMRAGEVYTLHPTPITTGLQFGVGHRIRVEIASTNFPKFERNLNGGGDNERATTAKVADNAIHHAGDALSYIELPVVR